MKAFIFKTHYFGEQIFSVNERPGLPLRKYGNPIDGEIYGGRIYKLPLSICIHMFLFISIIFVNCFLMF